MGKHRAIDPDEPFEHPHVIGETRPNQIKANLDAIQAKEAEERDRVVRERGQSKN
ncbi:MAG TPA: hypothetical protein VFU47_14940 [Armatimonadota bacterium]|nr:hypothetical protein [Armatimonadota bacterium]